MKGFIKKLFFFVVVLGIASLMIYAIFFDDSDQTYSLEHLHYDVEMLSDGDALVTEERLYSFKKGAFTRGFFELEDGIEDITVYEEDRAFNQISDFDESRPEGAYAYKNDNGVTKLEWYIRAQGGEEHTYNISYRVKEATILYNDCAVYFQKFLSQKNTTEIEKLTATIHLVPSGNSDNTLIWGHGPASGSLAFDSMDDSKVNLEINNVPIRNYVEARFVLDKELMSNTQYIEDVAMRESVIEEETKAAKEADRNRRIAGISSLLAYILGGVLILLPVILRIKKKQRFTRYTPELQPTFYRDIPEDIPPAVLDKLYDYYGKGGNLSKQVSGTVIDLIQRKMIAVSYQEVGRKKETYLRPTKQKYEPGEITELEKVLINFFFRDIGEGKKSVSISEIKKYCKRKRNRTATSRMFDLFTRKLGSVWNKKSYEEHMKNVVPRGFLLLKLLSLAIVIASFALFSSKVIPEIAGAYLILIVAGSISFVINIIVSRKKRMLSQKGENSLALWKGFYKFLNDFTLFDEKELPELFMWERYLVYATVLGIAEKVLKQLKLKYPQLKDPEYIRDNMLFYSTLTAMDMDPIHGLRDIESSIQTAVRDAQNVISNLSSSSSSGGGGGFSSGGSSGGSGAGGSTGGGMD